MMYFWGKAPVQWCLFLSILCLAGCSTAPYQTPNKGRYAQQHDSAPANPRDISQLQEPTPKAEPKSRYGNPSSYTVNGQTYHVLASANGYDKTGLASWYGTKFQGHRTSSGEPYDMYKFTAANKVLPLPTYARVTNLDSGRSVIVKVNDRGPFHAGRIIDLSWAAAKRLGIMAKGTGRVRVQALTPGQQAANQAPITTSSAHPDGNLYLQLGAFHKVTLASQLQQQVNAITNATIVKRQSLFKLWAGPYKTVSQRKQARKQLEQQGFNAFPVAGP